MESCSVNICLDRPRKKFFGRPGGNGTALFQTPISSVQVDCIVLKMPTVITLNPRLNAPSFRGLLVFWSIQTLLVHLLPFHKNSNHTIKVQAGIPSDLNLNNLPTVRLKGHSGFSHKAVARPKGASRFCALKCFWPYIRGRDGPG